MYVFDVQELISDTENEISWIKFEILVMFVLKFGQIYKNT